MDSVFIRSFIVQAPTICGVKLRPLSCWHVLCLMQFDNAFVASGEPQTRDLIQALLICKDGRKEHLKTYLRFSNSRLHRFLFTAKMSCYNIDNALDEFRQYFRAFSVMPRMWQSPDGKRSGALWVFHMVAALSMHLRTTTVDDVWDLPMCEAGCYRAVIAESNGLHIAEGELSELEEYERMHANG